METLLWAVLALLFFCVSLAAFLGSRSHRDHHLADSYKEFVKDSSISFYNPSRFKEIRGNRLWRFAGPVVGLVACAIAYTLRNMIPFSVLIVPTINQFIAALFLAGSIRDYDDQERLAENLGIAFAPRSDPRSAHHE